ncbi:MAG TPA: DUF1576 domain-containing protein [Spirochaetaceae bacterium]|nr:DUF1576 domain-containing protein [Spirochaetaceae bacterium]HOI21785.1 DUF1576 domain-containing protein [Spirochaetales bacterium]
MALRDRILTQFLTATILLLLLFGISADGPAVALEGFWRLQSSPARLLSDYTAMQGTGAALLNAAAVGIIGWLFAMLNGISFSGPTIAAVFTMIGFALFGKTPLNCIPIMAGVSLSALIVRKKPREYLLIGMFGTALGPLVSFVAFEMGLTPTLALPVSLAVGLAVGIVLPPLAIAMLHLHQGYNLYNIGLTAGFIGLFAASLPSAGGKSIASISSWGTAADPWLFLFIPLLSLIAAGMAFICCGKKSWNEFLSILKLPGRLPSDFCELSGPGGALLNAGILGMAYSAYVAIVGAPFNGPVIGGLMTLMGFAFFGKHPRNVIPVFLGLLAAALLFGKTLNESWVILAFLFGTALAPIAGEFGPGIGILAGFLHLVLVERSGTWHGGMNLYNNGFAGGLTATLIVSVIEWYRTSIER